MCLDDCHVTTEQRGRSLVIASPWQRKHRSDTPVASRDTLCVTARKTKPQNNTRRPKPSARPGRIGARYTTLLLTATRTATSRERHAHGRSDALAAPPAVLNASCPLAAPLAVLNASCPPATEDTKPALNSDDDSTKGSRSWDWCPAVAGGICTRRRQVHTDCAQRRVRPFRRRRADSRTVATHKELKEAEEPKPIETTGNKKVFVTAIETIVGYKGSSAYSSSHLDMIAPAQGRNPLSAVKAQSRVDIIFAAENRRLRFDSNTLFPLN